MKSQATLVKVSFPFYPADLATLKGHVALLKAAGLPSIRRGTVVRSLVCLPSAMQMFAHALLLDEAQKAKGGYREDDCFADTVTVRLPQGQLEKLDEVKKDLAAKGVAATRASIVRAVFRALPTGTELVAFMKRFQAEFPNRPRGLPVAKLRKAKHGGA